MKERKYVVRYLDILTDCKIRRCTKWVSDVSRHILARNLGSESDQGNKYAKISLKVSSDISRCGKISFGVSEDLVGY